MKSRITNSSILKKGIATILLTIIMLAQFSVLSPIALIVYSKELDESNWEKIEELTRLIEEGSTVISINNVNQLKILAQYINAGKTAEGITFNLKNNISLSNNNWVPIGNNSKVSFHRKI